MSARSDRARWCMVCGRTHRPLGADRRDRERRERTRRRIQRAQRAARKATRR